MTGGAVGAVRADDHRTTSHLRSEPMEGVVAWCVHAWCASGLHITVRNRLDREQGEGYPSFNLVDYRAVFA